MKMTRGHFDALAAALADARPELDGTGSSRVARDAWASTVLSVASACRKASAFTRNGNRSFDRDRFFAASGYDDRDGDRTVTLSLAQTYREEDCPTCGGTGTSLTQGTPCICTCHTGSVEHRVAKAHEHRWSMRVNGLRHCYDCPESEYDAQWGAGIFNDWPVGHSKPYGA